jgi:ubiquinone/menaquinone biosynthesis C-methylase UbiE
MIPRPGLSREVLPTLSDNTADLIYIDASHLYEDVREDIRQAARITKPSGTIILNDYILYDHIAGVERGAGRQRVR